MNRPFQGCFLQGSAVQGYAAAARWHASVLQPLATSVSGAAVLARPHNTGASQNVRNATMPSVTEILAAFRAAGTSDAAVEAIASLELSADDLLDINPAEVWGVADDDAERIAGAIAAFNSPPRVPQPPGPPPPPGALPPMPSAPPSMPPATGARCLVVAGPPGAGKTTLAAHAAAHLKAALIDKDALEWPLANCALKAAGAAKDDAYYNSTIKPSAYETCFRVAAQNCAAGIDVVMVAPFTSYVRDATFLETLSKRFGARVALLWVFADAEVLARRQRQ